MLVPRVGNPSVHRFGEWRCCHLRPGRLEASPNVPWNALALGSSTSTIPTTTTHCLTGSQRDRLAKDTWRFSAAGLFRCISAHNSHSICYVRPCSDWQPQQLARDGLGTPNILFPRLLILLWKCCHLCCQRSRHRYRPCPFALMPHHELLHIACLNNALL